MYTRIVVYSLMDYSMNLLIHYRYMYTSNFCCLTPRKTPGYAPLNPNLNPRSDLFFFSELPFQISPFLLLNPINEVQRNTSVKWEHLFQFLQPGLWPLFFSCQFNPLPMLPSSNQCIFTSFDFKLPNIFPPAAPITTPVCKSIF